MLSKSTPTQRKAIIKSASPDQIHSICEICHNILAGNVGVNVAKVKKYKTAIRQIANKKIPIQKKKKILTNQMGGFLPLVIPAVLSALGGIVGKVIGKHI